MKIRQWMKSMWKPVAGLAGLAVLVIWSAGTLESKVEPGQVAHEPGIPVPAGATPVVVRMVPTASRVEVVGTVASEQRITLSARLGATLQEVRVSAGDAVTNGQLLVVLDDRELREQVAAAEAQSGQAVAEFSRATRLFEKGAATEQARLAAESGARAAQARLEQVRVMLGYTRITSPIDGVVSDRRIEPGDLAGPGQVLLSVYDPRRMRLEVPVPVRLVSRFALNQEVELRLEGVGQAVTGVVREIVGEVDPSTRTQKFKVSIKEVLPRLLPGGYGSLWVGGDVRQTLWVPGAAVYRVGQQEFVQVVTGGRAIQRAVKTGVMRGGQVEILSGLDDGEAVLPVAVMKEG
jgi:RND family efflux transporter MFP subunit